MQLRVLSIHCLMSYICSIEVYSSTLFDTVRDLRLGLLSENFPRGRHADAYFFQRPCMEQFLVKRVDIYWIFLNKPSRWSA